MGNNRSRLCGTFDDIGNFKKFVCNFCSIYLLPIHLVELDLEESNPGYPDLFQYLYPSTKSSMDQTVHEKKLQGRLLYCNGSLGPKFYIGRTLGQATCKVQVGWEPT
jgi:hypothetical protein